MLRRSFLQLLAALGLLNPLKGIAGASHQRVRPTDAAWPTATQWNDLAAKLDGALTNSESAASYLLKKDGGKFTKTVLQKLVNPYYLQDFSGSTQSLGWIDGWKTAESAKVGIPKNAADVAELVNFARKHDLRLVIKGGGHSYFGQSNAADSLLIWTKDLKGVDIHDDFVPQGGTGPGQTAVTVASGEEFVNLYNKVVVEAGRYVQGGGCTSVGVGGHTQGGGFGHFSKYGGMTAANLLQAEIVVANGDILIANEYQNSDLYWALKGGGAGWGVTTRLTLSTCELPALFGFIGFGVEAKNESTYRQLVQKFLEFTRQNLINPNWGEQVHFAPDFRMYVKMTSIDFTADEIKKIWAPLLDMVDGENIKLIEDLVVYDTPAQRWWDMDYREKELPETIVIDQYSNNRGKQFYWNGDNGETSVFWAGYESAWLSQSLLEADNIQELTDTIIKAANEFRFAFHFQKGLAGASEERLAQARNTPVHPSVLDAFALLLCGAAQQNVYDQKGLELDETAMRLKGKQVEKVYEIFRVIQPDTGSYSAEMNFHDKQWRTRAWGDNYPKLLEIKNRYDPDGLFTGHHQVGSEYWSKDGFVRTT